MRLQSFSLIEGIFLENQKCDTEFPGRVFNSFTIPPTARITATVIAGDDRRFIADHSEEQRVGKPLKEGAADVSMDPGKLKRVLPHPLDSRLKLRKEFLPKSGSLVLVPIVNFLNFGLGRRAEEDPSHRILSRTR